MRQEFVSVGVSLLVRAEEELLPVFSLATFSLRLLVRNAY